MPVNASSGFSSVVPPISPTLAVVAGDAGCVGGTMVVGSSATAVVLDVTATDVLVLPAMVVLD